MTVASISEIGVVRQARAASTMKALVFHGPNDIAVEHIPIPLAGTLSSLGVYSGKLSIPLQPFLAGIGDHKIVTTLCPGGKERMRRLIELVRNNRVDLTALLTHAFPLEDIVKAYQFFEQRSDGVVKVAIKP